MVYDLSREILGERPAILEASKLFGELDSLIALALAAVKYGWTKPQMTASNIIDIADGRHPLQELLVPSFIPNDCVLTGGRGEADQDDSSTGYGKEVEVPSILILTGPNSSGKSIYMKQVALIVYLAHIGSYVPASRATIGITDRILTRIATRETMMADESAFCIDLKQAAFSVHFATRRSLIVADEFGKGTTWHCGAGLLAAYVTHFQTLDEYRPKLLIGTHFHELHDYGVLPRGNGIEYAHLDVRLDPDAEELEDQITYLYKLLSGPGGQSLGILCAELMGVEGRILEQAEYFLKVLKGNTNQAGGVTRERTREVIERGERLRSAERVFQRFLTLKIPEADAPQEELDKVKDMLAWCVLSDEEHDDDNEDVEMGGG